MGGKKEVVAPISLFALFDVPGMNLIFFILSDILYQQDSLANVLNLSIT